MGRMERRQQQKQQQKSARRIGMPWRSKGLIFKITTATAALIACMFLVFNIAVLASDVSKLEDPAPQPTIIYDQNGKIASTIAASDIKGVGLDEIPKNVIHAVIATEDQRFYKHHGINYVGIARAFVENVKSGEVVAGGSTITQQLAKNVFLTQDRTYTRKLKELVLTKKIERTYSKDEIIVRYLNQIYFGEGAWGIERAAETYFGKNAKDLTLSESAILAGLIKAPSVLSPVKNFEKSMERRNVVLSLMQKEGYITQSEVNQAKAQKIVLKSKKATDDYDGKYPHYVDHIIEEASEKYGLNANEILAGGYSIYTELNPTMQEATEKTYANNRLFPNSPSDQLVQSSAVFVNPSTGGIQALIGGRGEHTFRQFNRATQLKRQPGSSMKPLAVYTPALENGYDIFDELQDRPLNISGYTPLNYDKRFRGEVTMYKAVIESYNVPAVWLLQKIGLEKGLDSVRSFGIPLEKEDETPAIALGGMHEGTSPLKMAQAFAAFANNGVMVEAHAIKEIKNADGETIGKWKKKSKRIMDAVTAQKITYMLKGVVQEGTGRKAAISGRDIAGKTGTTQLPIQGLDGAKDHWFVGYTPEIAGAVWLGYDKTDASHYLSSSSGSTSAVIFKEIISKSQSVLPDKTFDLSLLGSKYKKKNQSVQVEQEEKQETEKQETEKQETEDKAQEQEEKQQEKEEEKQEKEEQKQEQKQEKENEKQNEKQNEEQKQDSGTQQGNNGNSNTTGNTGNTIGNTGNTTGNTGKPTQEQQPQTQEKQQNQESTQSQATQ
ncbi:transglycosylase domain-containing protein [Bacillus sp. OTU530]|uniref:transglycosylase domain-containing protein n=1 Tax=Bacillus sp. OTU530 TaxID=3043862 RepID=UPI00406CAF69